MMTLKIIFLAVCCLWMGCILSAFTGRIQVGTDLTHISKDGIVTQWGFPVWWKEEKQNTYPRTKCHKMRLVINSALWSILPLTGLFWLVQRTKKKIGYGGLSKENGMSGR